MSPDLAMGGLPPPCDVLLAPPLPSSSDGAAFFLLLLLLLAGGRWGLTSQGHRGGLLTAGLRGRADDVIEGSTGDREVTG